jgi:5-(carboxyamino)imidazole ribonucleotide mutase
MGSDSDWPVMEGAARVCADLSIGCEVRVLSAHRTPEATGRWAGGAAERGLQVLIAGAGGAAHLPGVVAAATILPVIGVPVANGPLRGMDALLAIVQMPKGIPVATVGIGRADNAALLAAHMMALADHELRTRLLGFREQMRTKVEQADRGLQDKVAALVGG